LLVLGCARPFEVWPSSSCQHGLVGDAIAKLKRGKPEVIILNHKHLNKED
jgi:hypothetical protein